MGVTEIIKRIEDLSDEEQKQVVSYVMSRNAQKKRMAKRAVAMLKDPNTEWYSLDELKAKCDIK